MYSKVGAGVAAGLLAAVICGALWSTMNMTLPPDHTQPQALILRSLGPDILLYRWLYKLLECAILGGLYGTLAGATSADGRQALSSGMVFGLACWLLGPVLIMPMAVGLPAASTLLYPDIRAFGVIGFFEWLGFGAATAGFFMLLYAPLRRTPLLTPSSVRRPLLRRPLIRR